MDSENTKTFEIVPFFEAFNTHGHGLKLYNPEEIVYRKVPNK